MFTTFEERIEDAQGVMMLKEAKDKAEGREEGIEIGIVQGTNEERERAIRNLFRVGSPDSFIVELGYTPEEIQKVRDKLDNLIY